MLLMLILLSLSSLFLLVLLEDSISEYGSLVRAPREAIAGDRDPPPSSNPSSPAAIIPPLFPLFLLLP